MANWSRKFPKPVALKDGRILHTLADAREALLAMNERRQRSLWNQYAAELLLKAAESGKRADIRNAADQMTRALAREAML
jgi:hypothetical protein